QDPRVDTRLAGVVVDGAEYHLPRPRLHQVEAGDGCADNQVIGGRAVVDGKGLRGRDHLQGGTAAAADDRGDRHVADQVPGDLLDGGRGGGHVADQGQRPRGAELDGAAGHVQRPDALEVVIQVERAAPVDTDRPAVGDLRTGQQRDGGATGGDGVAAN